MRDNPFTTKSIARLSWPVFIEFALGATVGISDTIMVSNVGDTAVSAVGLIDSVNMLFINVFTAVATGTTVVVAQLYGKGDKNNIRRAISQSSLLLCLIMGVVAIFVIAFNGPIFDLIYPSVDTPVRNNALSYFFITALTYPLVALFSNLSGTFRGKGNTKIAMQGSIIINIVNISLNAVFIYGFDMGVAGAALATLIGRACGCLLLLRAEIHEDGAQIFRFSNMRFTRPVLSPILTISLPAGLDALLFQSGKIIVSSFIGTMSTAAISANVIAMSTFGLISIPGNSLAVAATTVVGQCYGAGLRRYAKKNLLKCIYYSTGLMAVISLILYFPAKYIIMPYNPSAEALPIAVKLFRLMLISIPTTWPTAFVTSNGLRAAGDVKYVTAVSIISMWTMRVFMAWVLGVKLNMGPIGVNLAMVLDWVLRSVFYMPRILSLKRLQTDDESALTPEESGFSSEISPVAAE
jgi:putative MATE family efflux protein